MPACWSLRQRGGRGVTAPFYLSPGRLIEILAALEANRGLLDDPRESAQIMSRPCRVNTFEAVG